MLKTRIFIETYDPNFLAAHSAWLKQFGLEKASKSMGTTLAFEDVPIEKALVDKL